MNSVKLAAVGYQFSHILLVGCQQTRMQNVEVMERISAHGPSFRSLGAVFADNCTALESSKVGYACALTIIRKNC